MQAEIRQVRNELMAWRGRHEDTTLAASEPKNVAYKRLIALMRFALWQVLARSVCSGGAGA
jgi:hypothetical protein